MKKTAKMTNYVKCLYCRTTFHFFENHPIELEFINGYPDICRKSNKNPSIIEDEDELWLEGIVEYEYTY